jgi:acyl-coenzyme A thioesterase PaaI-like protein
MERSRCAAAANRLSGLEQKFQLPVMSDLPAGLPPGAELASCGGSDHYLGPLYRLPDLEGGALIRFAVFAAKQHLAANASVDNAMLMGFMDTAMAQTACEVSATPGCTTISLTSDFIAPARLGALIEAQIRITRQTRTMVFLSGEIVSDAQRIMIATGLWKIPPRD